MLVILKGGSQGFAAYYFSDFLFDTASKTGGWEINFTTGNGGALAGLSHFSVYLRDPQDVPDDPCELPDADCNPDQQNDVPEPTTLALMGVGLLGAGIARRRK